MHGWYIFYTCVSEFYKVDVHIADNIWQGVVFTYQYFKNFAVLLRCNMPYRHRGKRGTFTSTFTLRDTLLVLSHYVMGFPIMGNRFTPCGTCSMCLSYKAFVSHYELNYKPSLCLDKDSHEVVILFIVCVCSRTMCYTRHIMCYWLQHAL